MTVLLNSKLIKKVVKRQEMFLFLEQIHAIVHSSQRSSHSGVICKKGVLKYFANFNKVAGLGLLSPLLSISISHLLVG